MNKFISGAMGVEVFLNANTNKFYFPDIPLLRHKRIKHIDFCSFLNATPSGATFYTLTPAYVTIVEQQTQNEMIQNLSTSSLAYNGEHLFINKIIDMQRSYISLPGATLANLAGKSLFFVFWFDEPTNRSIVPTTLNRTAINSFEILLTGAKTFFPENLQLKDKMFQSLLLTFPLFSPLGNDGVSLNSSKNKFITLSRNNLEFFKQIPVYLLYQTLNYYKLRFQNVQFDFQNSYIETVTTTADDLKTVFFNCILDDNR